jgi:hypothetical protein
MSPFESTVGFDTSRLLSYVNARASVAKSVEPSFAMMSSPFAPEPDEAALIPPMENAPFAAVDANAIDPPGPVAICAWLLKSTRPSAANDARWRSDGIRSPMHRRLLRHPSASRHRRHRWCFR